MKILHGGDTHYHLGGGVEEGQCHGEGHDHHDDEGGENEHDDDYYYHEGGHDDEHVHRKEAQSNINVDAAFIHALGDLLMSIGVVCASLIIFFFPTFTYADPACTFIFSITVCCTTVPIMKKCLVVLMEGAPPTIDVDQLIEDIKGETCCKSIHDFHIWSISVGKYALSAHVDCEDPMVSLNKITKICKSEKYGLDHLTIQMENSKDE